MGVGENVSIITFLIIIANVLFSLVGFSNQDFFHRFKFNVGAIRNGEIWRMVSGNFLHGDWGHLLLNMYSFYIFGSLLEGLLGGPIFLILYFGSMLGGDLLALLVHWNHPSYSSIGASGAVAGVIFAFVMFFPMHLLLLFFILPIPAVVFGVLYVAYSLYGIPTRAANLGHEAHLGGAMVGAIVGFLCIPLVSMYIQVTMLDRLWLLAVLVVPTAIVLYLYVSRPDSIRIVNMWSQKGKTIMKRKKAHDRYYNPARERRKELDALLDKVARVGINGLTDAEQKRLKELSDSVE
jgi:membrane associated rhomboid family serine protease